MVWDSRFLTGRTARFGMTSFFLLSVLFFLVLISFSGLKAVQRSGGRLSQRWNRCIT
jgi:hypothetical protein